MVVVVNGDVVVVVVLVFVEVVVVVVLVIVAVVVVLVVVVVGVVVVSKVVVVDDVVILLVVPDVVDGNFVGVAVAVVDVINFCMSNFTNFKSTKLRISFCLILLFAGREETSNAKHQSTAAFITIISTLSTLTD